MADDVILRAEGLVKHYPIKGGVLRRTVGHVKAVDGVSFDLHKGETLGVVGESGCGKSTLGRLLMRLEEPTAGRLEFDGVDIYAQSGRDLRRMRRDIQIVFQDPYTSLNPRMTVGDIVGEPFDIHPDVVPKKGRRKAVQDLLDLVGLSPEHINRYPHQFSGGQRQRIGIARGIALNPKVLVCDEPVSALDVSVQAQVVNLMEKLQNELGLAYVFIAHDLSVVRHISDRVAVMYLGRLAELGENDRGLRPADPPVHPGAALRGPGPRPDPARAPGADRPQWRRPLAGEPAVGVPVPHPVLQGPGAVQRRGASARAARRRYGHPPLCVPLRGAAPRHRGDDRSRELTRA